MVCLSASFFRRSPLALGRWLLTFRAMAVSSVLKNSHSRSISRRMPAHVGAGVPANRKKHRGLSPRGYDFTEAERVRYDTYGNRTTLAPDGITPRAASSYNQNRGFTGYYLDKETGNYFARGRIYISSLGRFANRDPMRKTYRRPSSWDGYQNGLGLYSAYFIPNHVDPYGLAVIHTEPLLSG